MIFKVCNSKVYANIIIFFFECVTTLCFAKIYILQRENTYELLINKKDLK